MNLNEIQNAVEGIAKPKVLGITAEDLLNRQVENIPCLIDPIIPQVGTVAIAGSSDVGKSALLRYLCLCVSSKLEKFLDFKINSRCGSAIYVSTEDDEIAVAYLLNRQNRDMMIEPEKFKGLRFLFDTTDVVNTLDKMLAQQTADLVCIDAFADLYGKSLNENNQVRAFLNDYKQLAQRHQTCIIFLHHCGKRTENLEPSKHNLIGSQGFEASMRLVMELRNDPTEDVMKHLCVVKANYLPNTIKRESYKLLFTENMTFIDTGERIPLESIIKSDNAGKDKYEKIQELRAEGRTLEEIAKIVGYSNKSGVNNFVSRYEKRNFK